MLEGGVCTRQLWHTLWPSMPHSPSIICTLLLLPGGCSRACSVDSVSDAWMRDVFPCRRSSLTTLSLVEQGGFLALFSPIGCTRWSIKHRDVNPKLAERRKASAS